MSTSLGPTGNAERTVLAATLVSGLLLLHRAVVIDEDKSTVVLGVGVTLSTLVAGAKVTLGVVSGQKSFRRALLLASVEERQNLAH